MILLFASLSGVIVHSLLGHPDFLQAGFLAIGSFIGGLVGARLSIDIKERYLQILVSVVILIAAAKLFFDSSIWKSFRILGSKISICIFILIL